MTNAERQAAYRARRGRPGRCRPQAALGRSPEALEAARQHFLPAAAQRRLVARLEVLVGVLAGCVDGLPASPP